MDEHIGWSVHFGHRGDTIRSVDWSWPTEGRWTESEREGQHWYPVGELTEEGARALIARFGLGTLSAPFLGQTIRGMEPEHLLTLRRTLERENGLDRLDPVSDRLGARKLTAV